MCIKQPPFQQQLLPLAGGHVIEIRHTDTTVAIRVRDQTVCQLSVTPADDEGEGGGEVLEVWKGAGEPVFRMTVGGK